MIGRGAVGRPFIFNEVMGGAALGVGDVVRLAYRHALLNVAWYGEDSGMRQMRGVLGQYFKGFAGASQVRGRVTQMVTLEGLRVLLGELFPAVRLEDVEVGADFAGHTAAAHKSGHSSR